ncbi:glycogen debranching enzyme, partial [Saccharothrix sp. MB29]|nr:glycogen debranching enzyme [Saccharothrix sp. MB29]
RGMRVLDDSFLLAFNAHHEDIEVTLPEEGYGAQWTPVVDTATGAVTSPELGEPVPAGGTVTLTARSLVVLQRTGQE